MSESIDLDKELRDFEKKLRESQVPLDPEFERVWRDNFWELIE